MSLVLVVIGLIILIVFPALKAVRDGTQRSLTNSNLTTLMRATAAFVQANGCLPCPTPAYTTGSGFGKVGGTTSTSMCNICSNNPEGIPPFISLGLPQAAAKDGWGHWITMRVDQSLANLSGGIKAFCTSTQSHVDQVLVSIPSGAPQQPYAVVFVSHGPNGWGAYDANPAGGGTGYHSYGGPVKSCTYPSSDKGFEYCNASGLNNFIDAPFSDNPADPFDDALFYFDHKALYTYLGNTACTGSQ